MVQLVHVGICDNMSHNTNWSVSKMSMTRLLNAFQRHCLKLSLNTQNVNYMTCNWHDLCSGKHLTNHLISIDSSVGLETTLDEGFGALTIYVKVDFNFKKPSFSTPRYQNVTKITKLALKLAIIYRVSSTPALMADSQPCLIM